MALAADDTAPAALRLSRDQYTGHDSRTILSLGRDRNQQLLFSCSGAKQEQTQQQQKDWCFARRVGRPCVCGIHWISPLRVEEVVTKPQKNTGTHASFRRLRSCLKIKNENKISLGNFFE